MKNAVVISGGSIDERFAAGWLENHSYEYKIAADKGLLFFQRHQILPSHIVGDFDSADASRLEPYRDHPEVEIRRFQPEKDWTDTEIAVKLALELSCRRIDILGATGSRIDHVLGNIQTLALAEKRGADCRLIDGHNQIRLIPSGTRLSRAEQFGRYVSLFAYGGDVTGLTLEGFQYPLDNFTLGTIGTRGVSNEIAAETAKITFTSGKLLMIESRD